MYAGCRCPRCADAVLRATKHEGCDVLACRRCGGGFLGAAVGLRLLAVLKPDVPPVGDGVVASSCPVCRADMRPVLASAAGVNVDVCAKHGVWFDGGDLVPVARAAARALGKPVPQVVDAFAEHARARTAQAPTSPMSPPAPGWQPPQGGRSTPPVDGFFSDLSLMPTGWDVAELAVGVALIPVEITFGIIGGFVDLFD